MTVPPWRHYGMRRPRSGWKQRSIVIGPRQLVIEPQKIVTSSRVITIWRTTQTQAETTSSCVPNAIAHARPPIVQSVAWNGFVPTA